jgi:hypothetical protein
MLHSIRPTRIRWQVVPARVLRAFAAEAVSDFFCGLFNPCNFLHLRPACSAANFFAACFTSHLRSESSAGHPNLRQGNCTCNPVPGYLLFRHLEKVLTQQFVLADEQRGWRYGYLRKSVI